jgi:hypothetical protein
MKTTMKKRPPRAVATPPSPANTSSKDIARERKNSALPADIEEPFLTPEEVKFHLLLTAENGFSMEAALERLEKKKAAKSTG